ncbi:MAG: YdcF family protein [Chloroflexota bacterium]
MDDEVLFDRKEIARTTQFLGIESDEPEDADIAFDLGGQFTDSAYIAADLYRRGVVRYVLVSGGKNKVTGANEAEEHRNILLAEGVPAEKIIVEDKATNTQANTRLSLRKVKEHIDPESIRSVVAIANWYQCRRAVMTLKQNWPEGIRYFTRTFEPEGVPRLEWHLHQSLTGRVLKELDRIPQYLERGDIADIEIENGAWV